MTICIVLIILTYISFAVSDSVIFHQGRWENCKFMKLRWDLPWYLRPIGDGWHLFNNIGEYGLFFTGFAAAYFQIGILNLIILVVIAWIIFDVFLHVVFK